MFDIFDIHLNTVLNREYKYLSGNLSYETINFLVNNCERYKSKKIITF